MLFSDFNHHKPQSLNEALRILKTCDGGVPLAGGTDLLVEIKKGLRSPRDIVSLAGIKQLQYVEENDSHIIIGSMTTLCEIISSPIIKKCLPFFPEALSLIGTSQVRNTATIGGNLCTGASCCDSAPILMALNASVTIAHANAYAHADAGAVVAEEKTISLVDFFLHNKKTILKRGEIMTRIMIPLPQAGVGAHYEKFGLREAVNICVASAAAMVRTNDLICVDARVVIGAVAPTPIVIQKAGNLLKGKPLSELSAGSTLLEQAGQIASDSSLPIDDIRGGATFRRKILKVVTQRAILRAIACSRPIG